MARNSQRSSRPASTAKTRHDDHATALSDDVRGHAGPVLLSSAQARFLRGHAHDLKALLQVGEKGISAALVNEVLVALEHHELIKVKVAGADRDERDAMIAELVAKTGAALVQRIGHVAVLYRPSSDKRLIVLPRT